MPQINKSDNLDSLKIDERIENLEKEIDRLKSAAEEGSSVQRDLWAANEKLLNSLVGERRKETGIRELLGAAREILKSGDFKVTSRRIFDACRRATGARAGYVALLSDDGAENELLFLEDGGMKCSVDPYLPMPIRGLRQESYKTGKVVYDNDFMKSEWIKFMPDGHMALPNVMFAPLNIEEKTVGIIGIACKNGDFDEDDAKLAGAFGEYAAIALNNSRNYEELARGNEELKAAGAAKDRLFQIIARDLSEPIEKLIAHNQKIMLNWDSFSLNEIKELLRETYESATSTHRLLNDLLLWSRSQTGDLTMIKRKISINKITEQTLKIYDRIFKEKLIEVDYRCDYDPILECDLSMMETTVRNLISVAGGLASEGGMIKIRCEEFYYVSPIFEDKSSIDLKWSVTCVGCFIEEIELREVFNIKPGRSLNKLSDTGVGLPLAKEFVERHDGEIFARFELGEGVEFSFRLPSSDAPAY